MGIENLTPAEGSTHARKRVGRGQGSGTGKTAARGQKGQKSRSGYKRKRNKITAVAELKEITVEAIRGVHKMANSVTKIKLVGASAKDLASKIKDENVTTTGN